MRAKGRPHLVLMLCVCGCPTLAVTFRRPARPNTPRPLARPPARHRHRRQRPEPPGRHRAEHRRQPEESERGRDRLVLRPLGSNDPLVMAPVWKSRDGGKTWEKKRQIPRPEAVSAARTIRRSPSTPMVSCMSRNWGSPGMRRITSTGKPRGRTIPSPRARRSGMTSPISPLTLMIPRGAFAATIYSPGSTPSPPTRGRWMPSPPTATPTRPSTASGTIPRSPTGRRESPWGPAAGRPSSSTRLAKATRGAGSRKPTSASSDPTTAARPGTPSAPRGSRSAWCGPGPHLLHPSVRQPGQGESRPGPQQRRVDRR